MSELYEDPYEEVPEPELDPAYERVALLGELQEVFVNYGGQCGISWTTQGMIGVIAGSRTVQPGHRHYVMVRNTARNSTEPAWEVIDGCGGETFKHTLQGMGRGAQYEALADTLARDIIRSMVFSPSLTAHFTDQYDASIRTAYPQPAGLTTEGL